MEKNLAKTLIRRSHIKTIAVAAIGLNSAIQLQAYANSISYTSFFILK